MRASRLKAATVLNLPQCCVLHYYRQIMKPPSVVLGFHVYSTWNRTKMFRSVIWKSNKHWMKLNSTTSQNIYITGKKEKKGKEEREKRWTALWGQDITHHIKPRLGLQTLLSPGGHKKRWGRHLVWAQTFIYYLLLRSKDKGNEDDCPVTARKQMNRTDLTELFTCCGPGFIWHAENQHTSTSTFIVRGTNMQTLHFCFECYACNSLH